MKEYPQIYLVDDNKIDILINKILIQNINSEILITSFIDPKEAIQFFTALDKDAIQDSKNIIFLDFCMPKLNGLQFLDLFKELDSSIKQHFEIYVVSSTIDPDEIKKITQHECCKDYIYKPLNAKLLNSLLDVI